MAGRTELSLGLFGVGVILAIVAIFVPWWDQTMRAGDESVSFDAGPFNQGNQSGKELIDAASSITTGLLMVVGVLAMLAGTVLVAVTRLGSRASSQMTTLAPWLGLVGVALVALALVLAIFMYPGDVEDEMERDWGFWDSISSGGSASISTAAGVGWYLGVGAVVLGIVGGGMTMAPSTPKIMTVPRSF